MIAGLVTVVVVVGGIYFTYTKVPFSSTLSTPTAQPKVAAPVATKAPPAAAPGTAAAPTAPAAPTAAAAAATPAVTPNSLAHVPANAINKAKGVIEARNASGQSDLQAIGLDTQLANKPAVAQPPRNATPNSATAMASVTPGVSASTELAVSAVEPSAEFRSFVANAKISGVFQGVPARAMINNRLVRTGEMVESGLGIVFVGVDPARRHLLFKDRAGALVARKY